jgi:hypothetical protein
MAFPVSQGRNSTATLFETWGNHHTHQIPHEVSHLVPILLFALPMVRGYRVIVGAKLVSRFKLYHLFLMQSGWGGRKAGYLVDIDASVSE